MFGKTGTILLSRQPRRPCRRRKWLIRTVMAFKAIARERRLLLTSHGLQTWDMLTALASFHGLRRKVFIPAPSRQEFERTAAYLAEQFSLKPSLTEYAPVWFDPDKKTKREALAARDERIVAEADLLVPVAIRTGGNMANLLERFAGKPRSGAYRTAYVKREEPLAYEIAESDISDGIKALGDKYLFHWTRAFDTAWPDETLLDFYRAVLCRDRYPRTACDSLLHIIGGRKLYASRRHRPGHIPAVSFTALKPEKLPPLMRWRPRYRQMAFEPYGIGIDRRYALEAGVRPVVYYEKKDRASVAAEDIWRSQSKGEITDWRREEEYRCRGDFDLSSVPPDKLTAVCRFPREAAKVQVLTGIKTLSFVKE